MAMIWWRTWSKRRWLKPVIDYIYCVPGPPWLRKMDVYFFFASLSVAGSLEAPGIGLGFQDTASIEGKELALVQD